MKRFTKWGAAAAVATFLVIGALAPAAMAGNGENTGVTTMRPFSDGSWAPQAHQGVSTMRPFSDGSWSPGTTGVLTMRPFSDGGWTPGTVGVLTMRPFSDPNAIGHLPAVAAAASHAADGSAGVNVGLIAGSIAGFLLLVAAVGYASRQRRARPA